MTKHIKYMYIHVEIQNAPPPPHPTIAKSWTGRWPGPWQAATEWLKDSKSYNTGQLRIHLKLEP